MSAEIASWLAVAVATITFPATYLAYRVQRGKVRLEYVVVSNSRILSPRISGHLQVLMDGIELEDPSVMQLRIVNTGDLPIQINDFNTSLSFNVQGAQVEAASVSSTRPGDINPVVSFDSDSVDVAPVLFNAGDMIELQIISEGLISHISMQGRIAGAKFIRRRALPYPPGSGVEGEMLGFDKFMWYLFSPLALVGTAILFGNLLLQETSVAGWARNLVLVALIVAVLVVYFARTSYLVSRRRMWKA